MGIHSSTWGDEGRGTRDESSADGGLRSEVGVSPVRALLGVVEFREVCSGRAGYLANAGCWLFSPGRREAGLLEVVVGEADGEEDEAAGGSEMGATGGGGPSPAAGGAGEIRQSAVSDRQDGPPLSSGGVGGCPRSSTGGAVSPSGFFPGGRATGAGAGVPEARLDGRERGLEVFRVCFLRLIPSHY